MPRCSNSVLCFANFLAVLVVAVPLICGGLSLSTEANGQCQRSLQWVTIVSGMAILVLSLLGIFGSCCRFNSFLWVYLLFMFVLIVLIVLSMAFSFALTSREAGVAMSDLRLGNASSWMQRPATRDWEWIEGCMVEVRLCDSRVMRLLATDNSTAAGEIVRKKEIYSHLLPLQIGCCKPPSDCGYKYVNETYWAAPGPGTNSTNGDCRAWSNERMCYGCDSCKAGMVEIARRNIVNAWGSIPILVVLVVVYSIGCCAFRNNRIDINIIHDDSYAMLG